MGLCIDVYRSADRKEDCTNNGISARYTRLTVVNVSGPFDPTPGAPAVILRKHSSMNAVHLVPAQYVDFASGPAWVPMPGHFMMGGNYGATSDSRFGEAIRRILNTSAWVCNAVSIHDRQE